MRAVVVTTGRMRDESAKTGWHPSPLIWLVDRPLIQHVCEGLVGCKIQDVDWVHDQPSDDVRRFLGQGERWGMRFRHYIATNGRSGCYERLRTVLAGSGDGCPVLFGHAERLVPEARAEDVIGAGTVLYGSPSASGTGEWAWEGWALLSGRSCKQFPSHSTDEVELARKLAGHASGECRWKKVQRAYGVRTLSDYLAMNRTALAEAGPSPRLSLSARVHPTAALIGPVHVGRDVEIGAGAVVGPNVTVGTNCVVDRGAKVTDTVLLPDTYVVRGARLAHVVADRDWVYRLQEDGSAVAEPRGPVASLSRHPLSGFVPAVARRANRAARAITRLTWTRPARRSAAEAIPVVG